MSDVTVRALGEEDWATYRDLRLAALSESPDAFVSTLAEEQELPEDFWRLRMRRSTRLMADRDGDRVGVVSLGRAKPIVDVDGDSGETIEQEVSDEIAELFAMWVEPAARGTGVAWSLVDAAANEARQQGRSHVMLWVSVDNGRAVAFYSSYGFRPADARRPVRTDESQVEMAMVLPVRDDPGAVPNSRAR